MLFIRPVQTENFSSLFEKKKQNKMENCCVTPNLSKMTRWDGDI